MTAVSAHTNTAPAAQSFAIFAMDDDEAEDKFCVFTSTSKSHHVSMTVEVAETTIKPKAPLMTTTGWINGLAFYDGVRARDAVVQWPQAWQEVRQSDTRKRKR